MYRVLALTMYSMSAAACGKATAAAPDSSNPVHCMAAFNWGAALAQTTGQKDIETNMIARGIYASLSFKEADYDRADRESTEYAKVHAGERDAMAKLLAECGTAQDNDPKFKAESSKLLEAARSVQ